MNARTIPLVCLLACVPIAPAAAEDLPPIPPIQRVLPPEGLEIPAEIRQRLEARLAATKKRLEGAEDSVYRADVEVFTKAVELALLHREFYAEKDFAKADWALDEANKRLDQLADKKAPWERTPGLVVQGYRSEIDGSAQPYGLVIPADHDFGKPVPLYVWLHGRGDKNTDLHFLQERATKPGQIAPPGAIVLHPFGRHCVGWKHAGEIDVFEAIASVKKRYRIDNDRIVLIGFSMGGAGAWHIGAHYADQFVAVSPGAGFAETARYQRLTPDKYPPWYEQKLWGLYDVPGYVRNLFNTQVIAYSGENDKQIQAARVMEEAYLAEGRTLTHLIGPGVEHKYEPQTLAELLKRLEAAATKGRELKPTEVHLQTQTLKYGQYRWVKALRLEEHWNDSRVDAEIVGPDLVRVTTKNVSLLELSPPMDLYGKRVLVDGTEIRVNRRIGDSDAATLVKVLDTWKLAEEADLYSSPLAKRPSLQGPIDDAFMEAFMVVAPTGKSRNPAFQAWCDVELRHFQNRWRALMRGELPVVHDRDVDPELLPLKNIILWGDADSNSVIRHLEEKLPIKFAEGKWSLGNSTFDGNRFAPVCIYPCLRPGQAPHYVVLNSGLTFREGHDRTNSLQNPKLPDWAIIDITQPPDAFSPGRIHDAGFFDEKWQLKNQPKAP
ncbi:MAG TPA: alpha/beta hydrolase-fold protein [Pirellulaceae bacterium]|nr:alpha/beta hydrolase-fold protein [Pirellulaceae bacterium]